MTDHDTIDTLNNVVERRLTTGDDSDFSLVFERPTKFVFTSRSIDNVQKSN